MNLMNLPHNLSTVLRAFFCIVEYHQHFGDPKKLKIRTYLPRGLDRSELMVTYLSNEAKEKQDKAIEEGKEIDETKSFQGITPLGLAHLNINAPFFQFHKCLFQKRDFDDMLSHSAHHLNGDEEWSVPLTFYQALVLFVQNKYKDSTIAIFQEEWKDIDQPLALLKNPQDFFSKTDPAVAANSIFFTFKGRDGRLKKESQDQDSIPQLHAKTIEKHNSMFYENLEQIEEDVQLSRKNDLHVMKISLKFLTEHPTKCAIPDNLRLYENLKAFKHEDDEEPDHLEPEWKVIAMEDYKIQTFVRSSTTFMEEVKNEVKDQLALVKSETEKKSTSKKPPPPHPEGRGKKPMKLNLPSFPKKRMEVLPSHVCILLRTGFLQ